MQSRGFDFFDSTTAQQHHSLQTFAYSKFLMANSNQQHASTTTSSLCSLIIGNVQRAAHFSFKLYEQLANKMKKPDFI